MSEKIKNITIKNVARIAEVNFQPPENGLIIIGGKNKAGKTTMMKSIFAGLGGKVPELKEGKIKGKVELELDNYNVTLYLNQKTNKIKLEEKTNLGVSLQSPKTMLKILLGKRCLDVPEFLTATPKHQVETLLKIVDIPGSKAEIEKITENTVDIQHCIEDVTVFVNEAYNQKLAEQRINNRKMKSLEVEVAEGRENFDLDIEEINIETLYKEKELAQVKPSLEKELEIYQKRSINIQEIVDKKGERIEELEKMIIENKGEIEEIIKEAIVLDKKKILLEEKIKALESCSIEKIDKQIEEAKENNQQLILVQDIKNKTDELEDCTKTAGKIKDILNKIKEYKDEAMENTVFPVPGLDIRSGQIYYNNHPLKDSSGAEQMLVATAIASSEIPKDGLQALFILDPPQLDNSSWVFLEEYATKRNIQIWIAKVEEKKEKAHIYLVEGVQQ